MKRSHFFTDYMLNWVHQRSYMLCLSFFQIWQDVTWRWSTLSWQKNMFSESISTNFHQLCPLCAIFVFGAKGDAQINMDNIRTKISDNNELTNTLLIKLTDTRIIYTPFFFINRWYYHTWVLILKLGVLTEIHDTVWIIAKDQYIEWTRSPLIEH